jgi:hypothetical protein
MSAPIVNQRNLERYIGQRVRLFGKYSASANTVADGYLKILSTDNVEIKCRLNPSIQKPLDSQGAPRVVCVTGRAEADGSISLDSNVADLGNDMDMNLMNESINLQFRKEFAHLFYAPSNQVPNYA